MVRNSKLVVPKLIFYIAILMKQKLHPFIIWEKITISVIYMPKSDRWINPNF
jgi:hypothetical protein